MEAESPAGSLEAALARLAEIVAELENGSLELEEALARFAEGAELLRSAERIIGAAEERVEELLVDGALRRFTESPDAREA